MNARKNSVGHNVARRLPHREEAAVVHCSTAAGVREQPAPP